VPADPADVNTTTREKLDVADCARAITEALQVGQGAEYVKQPSEDLWGRAFGAIVGLSNEIERLRGERFDTSDTTVRKLALIAAQGLTIMRDSDDDEDSWELPDLRTISYALQAVGGLVRQAEDRRRFKIALQRIADECDKATPDEIRAYVKAVASDGASSRTTLRGARVIRVSVYGPKETP
jgi:hypothetical protein